MDAPNRAVELTGAWPAGRNFGWLGAIGEFQAKSIAKSIAKDFTKGIARDIAKGMAKGIVTNGPTKTY